MGTPGFLYWLKAKTGRFSMRPANGFQLTVENVPVVMSRGAVSPITRATATITPVMMPAEAVGRTTLTTVRHFGTPRAYDDSRRPLGTTFSISSVERTTIGIISTDSATAPITPSRMPGPRKSANSANANRPATIDGIPVMTSTKKMRADLSRPRPYSFRYTAAMIPIGTETAVARSVMTRVPTIAWYAPPPAPTTLRADSVKKATSNRAMPAIHHGVDDGRPAAPRPSRTRP